MSETQNTYAETESGGEPSSTSESISASSESDRCSSCEAPQPSSVSVEIPLTEPPPQDFVKTPFLDSIVAMVKNFSPTEEEQAFVESAILKAAEGEKVLGAVSTSARILTSIYLLGQRNKLRQFVDDVITRKNTQIPDKSFLEALDALKWAEIYEAFPNHDGLAIRAGWIVVEVSREEKPSPFDRMFSQLLGRLNKTAAAPAA